MRRHGRGDARVVRPGKRAAVLGLTILLAGLGVYAWWAGVGDRRMAGLLASGVVLGALYSARGGSLPAFVYRFYGSKLTRDDDRRNLSPKVYLPILLGAVVVAWAIYFWWAPKR